ncbi:MAG TPA: pseudouridine synthase, partial [Kofleriaceae bacterium]|nr:pseudouridine synthase [Kofleriaceae bacterium]
MAAPVRLQRYLSAAGVAARRKAEDLIVAGRVQVNGAVVTTLGTKIDPDQDSVLVDGEAVVALDRFYVLFNKPKGCITAVTDDRGRPTVMDYLPNLPVPVKPVGRLDFYSEGVLLLTNDGDLAARLLAPANHVPKTYHVKVHGRLTREELQALRDGVTLDDGTTTLPAEVEVLPGETKHTWLGITIHEGKHRQIHRMIEALGHSVDKLQRVAFATLTFHDLRVGDARELTQQELNELRDLVGLDRSVVARGRWTARREDTDIPRRARAKARAEAEAEAEARGLEPDARELAWGDDDLDEREAGDAIGPRDTWGDRGPAREARGGFGGRASERAGARGRGASDRAGEPGAGGSPGERGGERAGRGGSFGGRGDERAVGGRSDSFGGRGDERAAGGSSGSFGGRGGERAGGSSSFGGRGGERASGSF